MTRLARERRLRQTCIRVDQNKVLKYIVRIAATSLLIGTFCVPALGDDVAEGRALYMRYCASCHGVEGDGHGPVARALKEQPADLRKLGERYGTPLPSGQIARFIDGRDYVAAHGKREMPVWGNRFLEIFEAKGSREGGMDERIRKIIIFLDSIQLKSHPAETPPSPVGSLH
jgi:Cytochrome C oxidase, cbb3-type, subunit III